MLKRLFTFSSSSKAGEGHKTRRKRRKERKTELEKEGGYDGDRESQRIKRRHSKKHQDQAISREKPRQCHEAYERYDNQYRENQQRDNREIRDRQDRYRSEKGKEPQIVRETKRTFMPEICEGKCIGFQF
jgi:hypothetical protein